MNDFVVSSSEQTAQAGVQEQGRSIIEEALRTTTVVVLREVAGNSKTERPIRVERCEPGLRLSRAHDKFVRQGVEMAGIAFGWAYVRSTPFNEETPRPSRIICAPSKGSCGDDPANIKFDMIQWIAGRWVQGTICKQGTPLYQDDIILALVG
jgi:hypothetical protein